MAVVYEPKSADVLCGRGKRSFGHPGNHCFRQLVVEHANSYKMAPTKKQKTQEVMAVAKTIIARGGRFLIPATTSDGVSCWKDGGLKHGKRKAGHALCDALRGRMSYIQLRKARLWPRDEMRSNEMQAQHASHQINGIPLETITSGGCFVSPTCSAVQLRTTEAGRARNEQQRMNYVQLLKAQPDGEIRAMVSAQQTAQQTAQTNAFSLETITSSSGFALPPTPYSTVEPSNDWMTASMDADLANYVRNLFVLSNGTK